LGAACVVAATKNNVKNSDTYPNLFSSIFFL
jgi:hypothetical protein